MSRLLARSLVIAALSVAVLPGRADASLTTFATFTGHVGYSSDGFGNLANEGIISAQVPAGAVVLGAYLYTSTFFNNTHLGVSATLNGMAVAFGAPVVNGTDCCQLASARADVTAIVKPIIDGGGGGIYDFDITEGDGSQDGEALVVVYELAALPVATVGILDGFSAVGGDSTTLDFGATGWNGGFAEMIIGDGFSCCGQDSTISVNGTVITEVAGNHDDGAEEANGSLITVGGFDDPYSTHLPDYANDHEKYNLASYLMVGDTSAIVRTFNPSNDDNIFMATFYVSGEARITGVPDQADTMLMLGLGLTLLGVAAVRRA
jgi:hypothetical protein